jgi:hypothetical protein
VSARPFFIGWAAVPPGLRGFLALTAVVVLCAAAGVALAIAASQPDPGDGGVFGWEDDIAGVIVEEAYPLLYVTEATPRLPAGSVVVMSALNKAGVAERTRPFVGQAVTASGLYTRRGDVAMLQLRGAERGVAARDAAPEPVPPREALGRWRLVGEVCDGKCYAGAMRPGAGISHKACAALCLLGEVPPLFVLAEPFMGEEYLLITTPDGRPVGPETINLTGALIAAEGAVERLGTLLIFRLDPATARAP